MEINGKEYTINTDTSLGTEKLISKIMQDPENPKNIIYMEHVLRDILLPTPTTKDLNSMRRSQREAIFEEFGKEMDEINKGFKKKHSLL